MITLRFCGSVMALCLILGRFSVAVGGTIRHDRRDEQYTDLAAQPQFDASGSLDILIGDVVVGRASGTLIDPQWILTAAHCVFDVDGPTGTAWRFQVGSQSVTIPAENVYFNPQWITTGFDSGSDIALLRLPEPIRGVRPAALSAATDELHTVFTTVGYGSTGTGETGNTRGAGTRRAGQNVVDAFSTTIVIPGAQAAPTVIGNARTLISDFDDPQASRSTVGSANALQLEYSAAPGDSGGGAFVLRGGGSRVIGVVSEGYRPNGLAEASYGTTVVYARLSVNMPWVRSVITGRESSLPTLVAQMQQGTFQRAVQVAAQRQESAARSGYQVCHFMLPVGPRASFRVPLPEPLGGAAAGDLIPELFNVLPVGRAAR